MTIRRVASALLTIGVVLLAIALVLWLQAPSFMDPRIDRPSSPVGQLVLIAIGALGSAVGLRWIWSIANLGEGEPPAWRYRDRR